MDLTKLFEAFYTKLLLRDFFAKIVPGSIVLVAIVVSKLDFSDFTETVEAIEKFLSIIPFYLWVIIAGLAWIMGFAVQSVGEFLGAIRYHPKTVSREQVYKSRTQFDAIASKNDQMRLERYVVIKEACGNGYMGIVIALFYNFVSNISQFSTILLENWASYLLSVLIMIFLARMHFEHVDRQHKVMSAVLDVKNNKSVKLKSK